MSFVSYFGFGRCPSTKQSTCAEREIWKRGGIGPCSNCFSEDNEDGKEISTKGLNYPTVTDIMSAYTERPHGSPAQKNIVCLLAKLGSEEEIGNENAPPPSNAQTTDDVQQDAAKSNPLRLAAAPDLKKNRKLTFDFGVELRGSKQKDIEQKPSKGGAYARSLKAKLPRPPKEEDELQPLPARKTEEAKIAGPFSDGSKLQVQLETGWVDCSETEMLQIGNQLAGDTKKFAINVRGAMYIMDFTDLNAPTQTHAVSSKIRQLRIVKP